MMSRAEKSRRSFADENQEGLTQSRFAVADDQNEGAPAWVVSFSDMVTLLLTFFVLLFALGEIEQNKFERLVVSMREALRGNKVLDHAVYRGSQNIQSQTVIEGVSQDDIELLAAVKQESEKILNELQKLIEDNALEGQITAELTPRGAIITISNVAVFPIGKATLTESGKQTMAGITRVLSAFPYKVKVEGHTDDVPINTREFPSNWELSTRRASEIVKFFIYKGVPPDQLSAEGFAEYRPVASNLTEAGRAKNRRVELVISQDDLVKSIQETLTLGRDGGTRL